MCQSFFLWYIFFYHSFLFFSLNLYTHPRKWGTYPRNVGTHPRKWGTYPRNVGTYPRNVGTYPSKCWYISLEMLVHIPRNVGTYPSKCWYISLEMLVHMGLKHPDFIGVPRPLKVFKKKY